MILRRRWRTVSLYVEWAYKDDSDALVRMLIGGDVRGAEIDRDVDLEAEISSRVRRERTVLRFCVRRDYPEWQLLTAVASYPGVFSVGEM